MNIAGIKKANTENGIGIRVSVFVSGCLNHCKAVLIKKLGTLTMDMPIQMM